MAELGRGRGRRPAPSQTINSSLHLIVRLFPLWGKEVENLCSDFCNVHMLEHYSVFDSSRLLLSLTDRQRATVYSKWGDYDVEEDNPFQDEILRVSSRPGYDYDTRISYFNCNLEYISWVIIIFNSSYDIKYKILQNQNGQLSSAKTFGFEKCEEHGVHCRYWLRSGKDGIARESSEQAIKQIYENEGK